MVIARCFCTVCTSSRHCCQLRHSALRVRVLDTGGALARAPRKGGGGSLAGHAVLPDRGRVGAWRRVEAALLRCRRLGRALGRRRAQAHTAHFRARLASMRSRPVAWRWSASLACWSRWPLLLAGRHSSQRGRPGRAPQGPTTPQILYSQNGVCANGCQSAVAIDPLDFVRNPSQVAFSTTLTPLCC